MVQDINLLTPLIDHFPEWLMDYKKQMGNMIESIVKEDVFNKQGPPTIDTDELNPRGINPKWKELSDITVKAKGSTTILMDTRQMYNFLKWVIEDSEFDELKEVVKVGWFEEAGDRVWIAAVHEFGLNGEVFRTPDGRIMGGEPIGRTKDARAKIRGYFKAKFNAETAGVIRIPERSMLRKAADILAPILEEVTWLSLKDFIEKI